MLKASIPQRPWHRWAGLLAAPLLCFAGTAWAAPHDLVVQHTGPTNAAVTTTATYTVKLDNTHATFTGAAQNVKLTFAYQPANVNYTTARFSGGASGSCVESTPGTVVCSLADIPHGATGLTVEFDLYVNGAALQPAWTGGGVAINPVATISSDDDRVSNNNSEPRNTTITPGTDLGVTLTSTPVSPASIVTGQTWSHDVTVTNNGPLNTSGAKVTLVPPAAGMRWVAASLPSGCTVVGANVECAIAGTFAKGATRTFTGLQAQAIGGGGSSLVATANVTSNLTDGVSNNNSASNSVAVTPGTDLKLDLSASGGIVIAGSPRTITVTPTYTGDVPDNPRFTITLPTNVTSVGGAVTPTGWSGCSWAGQTLTCTTWDGAGTATAGAGRPMGTVTFPVTGLVGTHTITGRVTSNTVEANSINNDATVNVRFDTARSNVTIAKSGPQAPYNKFTNGATIQYTVTLTNTGNVPYYGSDPLRFTENAPMGLTVTGITTADTGWDCNTARCEKSYTQAASLAVNGTVTFTVTATVNDASGTNLVNGVCRAAYTHPALGTQTAQACASADAVSGNPDSGGTDLSVAKTAGTATVKAGEWLAYTVVATNGGAPSRPAANVVVKDRLDNLSTSSAASFEITAIPAGWTCTGNGTNLTVNGTLNTATVDLECSIATFGANATATVEFRVRPLGTAASGANLTRPNRASIESATQEPDFANNRSTTVNTTVTALTDFTIAKAVTNGWDGTPPGAAPGKTGTELQYTITVTNLGRNSGASNVVVTDVLPENVTYLGVSNTSHSLSCSGLSANATTTSTNKTLICTWPAFDSSTSEDVSRSFIVRIRPNHEWQGHTLTNNAYVNVNPGTQAPRAGTTEETSYANNAATASALAGEADIDLQVDKRDLADPVYVGANVDYEVTIVNNGPSVATNASIYDYLPVKGFTWVGGVKFYQVNPNGTRGAEITSGPSCSKTPNAGDHGAGGEDAANPAKLNWLWPMNVTGDTTTNPHYVNGKWDPRIASQADIICNMGTMLPDTRRMLVYTLKAEERGVYMNHSIVRSQEHIDRVAQGFADSVWNNDAIQHRTTVRSLPDVALTKEVSKSPVALREPFTYTITVTNKLTAEPAHAPQVRDALPANMELTGAPVLTSGAAGLTGGGFSCNAPPTAPNVPPAVGAASQAGDTAFICTLGTGVAPGATVVITVPVRVNGGGAATLTNEAALHLDTDLVFDSEPPPAAKDDVPVNVVVSSIAGQVYHDANNNGVRDGGEAPINGVTVTLTGTDSFGNPVTAQAVTAGNGAYLFDNLAPGTYTVTETHPSSWLDGKDTVGVFGPNPGSGVAGNDVISAIALPANTAGTQYNFGERQPLPAGQERASISGFVYHDVNDDGDKQPGEPGIAGVTVTLTGPGGEVRTATTDANGFYQFTDLVPGVQYTVHETQPGAWADGKDKAGTAHTLSSTSDDQFVVTTVSGGDGQNWNFGERRPPEPVASISGYVYHDANDNGAKDTGEEPIAGVTITLTGNDGSTRTATTNASGYYEFTGLQPGVQYTVAQTQPQGWTDGKDTAGTVFAETGGGANDRFVVTPKANENGQHWNFGERKAPTTPASIPTLSEWGLILLSLMMAGFALRRVGVHNRR